MHFGRSSQEFCRLQQDTLKEASEVRLETWDEIYQRERDQIADAKRVSAVAAHRQVRPSLTADIDLTRNGERQLMKLYGRDLQTLGLLTFGDIYAVNQRLRQGSSLETSCPGMLDYYSYETQGEFVAAVDRMFAALDDTLELDRRLQVFRGVDVNSAPTDYSPDVAGIGAYLRNGTQWQADFVDAGIGFATTTSDIAMFYPPESRRVAGRQCVLLELDVHRALCLPTQKHQSHALFEHVAVAKHALTDVPHLVFPRGTAWKITSIETQSAHGRPVVHMRQE